MLFSWHCGILIHTVVLFEDVVRILGSLRALGVPGVRAFASAYASLNETDPCAATVQKVIALEQILLQMVQVRLRIGGRGQRLSESCRKACRPRTVKEPSQVFLPVEEVLSVPK